MIISKEFEAFLKNIPGRPEIPLFSQLGMANETSINDVTLNALIGTDHPAHPFAEHVDNDMYKRVWKYYGKDVIVIVWDMGNGWCDVLEVWPNV